MWSKHMIYTDENVFLKLITMHSENMLIKEKDKINDILHIIAIIYLDNDIIRLSF